MVAERARLAARSGRSTGRRARHRATHRLRRGGEGCRPHRRRPATHDAAPRRPPTDADDLVSRLIFRPHPNMVRAAWVRGRLLGGPPGVDGIGQAIAVDRVIQLIINAAALYVAQLLVDGLDFDFSDPDAWWQLPLVALIFGLVNTFLKPILRS